MHRIVTTRVAIAALVALCSAQANAAQAEHIPTNAACGDIWYSVDYEPSSIESLDELPPEVRGRLSAYLDDYLGPDYVSKLKLTGGQLLDREELLAKVPESVDFKWKAPKYNLFLVLPVAGSSRGLCGSVELDDDGTVMSPIGFPKLREHPERGKIASSREATRVAERNGVPVGKANRDLVYFPDSDTIEYDFAFVSVDDGVNLEYTHLHVLAHDVSQIHWSRSTAIR